MVPSKKQIEREQWFERDDEENKLINNPMREPLDPEELEIRREQQKYKKHNDEREF